VTENIRMEPPASGVTVRMYNTGFGDCFVLAFRKNNGKPFYMMIDCGVHGQYKDGGDRIKLVVEKIKEDIGEHLDLVVATHEHSDHVSGFYHAREIFKTMTIEHAWLAWTEKPGDKQADRLDKKKAMMFQGLMAAFNAFAASGDSDAEKSLKEILGFYLPFGISTRKSRDKITEYIQAESPKYLEPKKEPERLAGVDDVRVFVLGPPRNEEYLLRARPSKRRPEVYHEHSPGFHLRSEDALAVALAGAAHTSSGGAKEEQCMPFAGNHRISLTQIKCNPDLYEFYHEHYGFKPDDSEVWRRIDTDWQQGTGPLALALDSATNNSSLVLAIELMQTGKVLLFTGDAQVGNWLSWHKGGWTVSNGLQLGETVSAEDLLHRTVMYKVGHHGSHNATLQEKGLEMMTSQDLTAMLPVDKEWARERRPYPWKMPFDPMYEDLVVRTKSRILRTDIGIVDQEAWSSYQKPTVVNGDDGEVLYVELNIKDI
jgi:Metallo-beta-lactamase superfamily